MLTRMVNTAVDPTRRATLENYGIDAPPDQQRPAGDQWRGDAAAQAADPAGHGRAGQHRNARLAALRTGSIGPISLVGFDRFGEYDVASNKETAPPGSSLLAGDRFGVFLTGNFGWGDRDSSSQITGFDFEGPALSFGADYRVNDRSSSARFFGYARFEADFDDNANSPSGQKFESDTYSFSLYGSYYPTDQIYIDALASVGDGPLRGSPPHRHPQQQSELAPAEDRRAKSNFDGTVWGGTVNTGYDYAFANGLT